MVIRVVGVVVHVVSGILILLFLSEGGSGLWLVVGLEHLEFLVIVQILAFSIPE